VSARIAIAALAMWVSALALASTRAAAAPEACPTQNDPAAGPLAGGAGPADFGAVPEACGATDLSLRLRGALLSAPTMPDYYGSFVETTLWHRYIQRTYFSSPIICDNLKKYGDGYSDATWQIAKGACGLPERAIQKRCDGWWDATFCWLGLR